MKLSDPYLNKKIVHGSCVYYALHFSPEPLQKSLAALYVIHKEILKIPYQQLEEAIAIQKLQWWKKEIERLYQSQPTHPATRHLTPHLAHLPKLLFEEIIESALIAFKFEFYETESDLLRHSHRSHSSIALLTAHLCGVQEQSTLSFARDIGVFLRYCDLITHLGRDTRVNRNYFPKEWGSTERSKAHCATAYVRTTVLFESAQIHLANIDRDAQRPLLLLSHLKAKQLATIQRSGFPVEHQYVRISPIRQFLAAKKIIKNI